MISCGNFFIVETKILAIIVLMFFAYLISLCSTSDPFVGKSLLNFFGVVPIISYLLLVPMTDIKNTIVLFDNYKKSFVVTLISLIFSLYSEILSYSFITGLTFSNLKKI